MNYSYLLLTKETNAGGILQNVLSILFQHSMHVHFDTSCVLYVQPSGTVLLHCMR